MIHPASQFFFDTNASDLTGAQNVPHLRGAAKRRDSLAQGVSPGSMSAMRPSPERAAGHRYTALSGLTFRRTRKPRAYALGYDLDAASRLGHKMSALKGAQQSYWPPRPRPPRAPPPPPK